MDMNKPNMARIDYKPYQRGLRMRIMLSGTSSSPRMSGDERTQEFFDQRLAEDRCAAARSARVFGRRDADGRVRLEARDVVNIRRNTGAADGRTFDGLPARQRCGAGSPRLVTGCR